MNSVQTVIELCKNNGISISKLERELGFANGYIKGLKKGFIPMDRLIKIANYFDIPVDYFYEGVSVALDEETVLSNEETFRAYLKSQGWNITRNSNGDYTIGSDNISVNINEEDYLMFEDKIRNECAETILGFIADSLNKERISLLAAHRNENISMNGQTLSPEEIEVQDTSVLD